MATNKLSRGEKTKKNREAAARAKDTFEKRAIKKERSRVAIKAVASRKKGAAAN